MIQVFHYSDFETAKNVICACADGGAKVVEFTNRGDWSINVFNQPEEFCAKSKPEAYVLYQ